MMKRSLIALVLAAALPVAAQASDLDYSYVQAGYSSTDVEGINFDGWAIKGSVAFGQSFYGVVGYENGSKSGVDLNQTHVGLGYHHGLSENTDLFGEVHYVRDEVLGFDDNGWGVAGGVRSMLGQNFEATAKLTYADVNDFGAGWGAGVSGVYHFTKTWGAYASYDYADRDGTDLKTWGVGVRASF